MARSDFYKQNPQDTTWFTDEIGEKGPILFSFDKKTVYNFWTDYPDKLTPEQVETFKRECPALAELKEA